jgi:hypothetical protein
MHLDAIAAEVWEDAETREPYGVIVLNTEGHALRVEAESVINLALLRELDEEAFECVADLIDVLTNRLTTRGITA